MQPLIDVEDYDTVEELMELGPDRLKEVHSTVLFWPLVVVLCLRETDVSV